MRDAFERFRRVHFDPETRCYVDSPTFRGFPLGGLGNGGISLFADGGFSECRTNHNWNVPVRDLRGSFFAVRTRDPAGDVAVRLLRRDHHHGAEFAVPNIAHTRFRGEVPHFDLAYEDPDLPVEITLQGFSPLIPHNVKDSSLPAVLFDLDVRNPTDTPLEVSALFSWQNVLGITGTACHAQYRRHAFRCDHAREGYAVAAAGDLPGLTFRINKDFPPHDPRRRAIGEYRISTTRDPGDDFSACTDWDARATVPGFWDFFVRDGRLPTAASSRPGPRSRSKRRHAGAICLTRALPAGGATRFPFTLCWFMPHYVIEKNALFKLFTGRHDGVDHGIYAQNHFSGVDEIAAYASRETERLRTESLELSGLLRDPERCSLPAWLTDAVLNAADSMVTNTVLTRRGDSCMIEGVGWTFSPWNSATHFAHQTWIFGALTGTLDQRLCAHPYSAAFFPDLDRNELETFRDLAEGGKVPHGNGGAEIALQDADTPYAKPIAWVNNGETDWSDLNCSLILQIGKRVKTANDLELLRASWPRILEMDRYLDSLVVDDVPEACSTYDVFVYKPCFLYAATLYAATKNMLADLAEIVPAETEPDGPGKALHYRQQARRTRDAIDTKLWVEDPGYYRVCAGRDTLFQGGLAGDWFSRLAGLPPVLDPRRARAHAACQDRALVRSVAGTQARSGRFAGRALPLNEATPSGEPVPLRILGRFALDVNYIYQVVSHQALEAIHLGKVREGIRCIRMIYEKAYAEGFPWEMSLFGYPGFIYMTHPVLWALFQALSGAALDLPRRTLHLAPRPLPDQPRLRVPVFFPCFWLALAFDADRQEGRVDVLKAFDQGNRPAGAARDATGERVVLDRLLLTRGDDTVGEVDLGGFEVVAGRGFSFSLTAEP